MLLSLLQCQLRHIHHASINIVTSVLGGLQLDCIWRINWSTTRYWRRLWLWRCVLWRDGWLLTNQGHLRWINDWIIQWRRHSYQRWWKLISIWVTVLAIKSPVITSVATTNTFWTCQDKCNMSLWWCCVHIIFVVDGQQKVGFNCFARQLHSCLSFSTGNKIYYDFFVSI